MFLCKISDSLIYYEKEKVGLKGEGGRPSFIQMHVVVKMLFLHNKSSQN